MRGVKKDVHTPTEAEVTNDPSLRWVCYRPMELVWSDTHAALRRFVRYEGEQVRLASYPMGIIEGPEGLVDALTVRRVQTGAGSSDDKPDPKLSKFHRLVEKTKEVNR